MTRVEIQRPRTLGGQLVLGNAVVLRKEPQHVNDCPSRYIQCRHCRAKKPIKEFKSKRCRRTTITKECLKCRQRFILNKHKEPTSLRHICKQVFTEWKKTHPCTRCGETDIRLIEADHIAEKTHRCGDYNWWSRRTHGPNALRAELYDRCQSLCVWCHRMKSKEERRVDTRKNILQKRAIINNEKLRRGCCVTCKKKVTKETFHCFDFDHREEVYKVLKISSMVQRNWEYFNEHVYIEMDKCDIRCCSCHKLRTHYTE